MSTPVPSPDDDVITADHPDPNGEGCQFVVDALGYVWRTWPDLPESHPMHGMWSMARVNPDNSPIPQPVQVLVPADLLVVVTRERDELAEDRDGLQESLDQVLHEANRLDEQRKQAEVTLEEAFDRAWRAEADLGRVNRERDTLAAKVARVKTIRDLWAPNRWANAGPLLDAIAAALAGDGDTAERPDRFTCPLCAQLIECRITISTGDDPADEAVLRMNLRVDEEPLRTHVKEAHS